MYNDYLAHYGVKGMKWGVRHDPDRLSRSDIKRIKKYRRNATKNDPNVSRELNKVSSQLERTKEYKDYNALRKSILSNKEIQKAKSEGRESVTLFDTDGEMTKIYNAYVNKDRDIMKQNQQNLARAYLKDVGLRDTEAGRDYLIRKGYFS